VLTDRCTEGCNTETKYRLPKSQEFDDFARIEYGYGSGYINGYTEKLKLSFGTEKGAPAISGIDILVAD